MALSARLKERLKDDRHIRSVLVRAAEDLETQACMTDEQERRDHLLIDAAILYRLSDDY